MRIKHTVSEIIQSTPQAGTTIGTTAAKVFTDIKQGDVIHLANCHASQIIYVKWCGPNETPTISSTNFYEQIPAGESRQFQFENPNQFNESKTLTLWILGSGASTSYNAVQMR
jgi:hypothetical protein